MSQDLIKTTPPSVQSRDHAELVITYAGVEGQTLTNPWPDKPRPF